MSSQDDAKRRVANAALAYVEPGMQLGLGTGSTAAQFVMALGAQVRSGLEIACVPTSNATAELAKAQGIPLIELSAQPLDLAIDGADEIGPNKVLIKGGGGALLKEKIVAEAAKRFIVIADKSKQVKQLGDFPLPVEIMAFGAKRSRTLVLQAANQCSIAPKSCELRRDTQGEPVVTDGGHWLLDLSCGMIPDARALAEALNVIPGVVEHGLFIDLADEVLIGEEAEFE